MSWLKYNGLTWLHAFCLKVLKAGPRPKHIGFIMDGNRRYAKMGQIETLQGHAKGYEKLKEVIIWCTVLAIPEITVYAFSIENFNRSKLEVDNLLKLLREKFKELQKERDVLEYLGISIRIVGDLSLIPHEIRNEMSEVVFMTKNNNKIIVNIAFAYTSRNEITNGMQIIHQGIQTGKIMLDDINESLLSRCLYCDSKVDLLIRTSGEIRFSDFLLWQSWCANVVFLKVFWPGMTIWHLMKCILLYQCHYHNQQMIEQTLHYDCEETDKEHVKQFVKYMKEQRQKEFEIYRGRS